MAAPNLCQLLDPRKGRSLMQINTALQRMGFATWSDLEPGKFSFWCSIFQLFRNKNRRDCTLFDKPYSILIVSRG